MDEQALKARLPDSVAARVQSIKLADGRATLVLDAAGLEAESRDGLESAVKQIIGEAEGVTEVRVAMVADKAPAPPPPKVPIIIAVGSGKGGVGKSTLTANLAVALFRMGRKVGVVDADVYGPSQPTILNNKGEKPEARDDKLVPVPSPHGIPLLSMGHLVEPGKALAWRGPMAGNAMAQLVDAHWGDTEVLLIDLPPGTGDVQLTMLSKFKPAGAVIVSTPQDLALIDAQRAANLFDSGKVPIIGLVENMSGYACPHCGEVSDPFGKGGVEAAADATGIPFLGRIPLALEIRAASDAGTPPAAGDGPEAEGFQIVAKRLSEWLDKAPATEAV
ncbi:Mrp/NBP35 family ATP-binding protein [Pontixanthobacter aestiaquae]|uniref:Iron-sulfur cluster carrier protein n=1 Tax=Pontixanthobacter aestiaquae TaxID=1509367 RepID=A0A844ZBV5_9SPHN|nr:Mrp/NBP35 family ATP-binding protein [Pontixanthobacter aestiaquae]MDN3644603.1 Mrp/NBP35 family ATP-binding protein [Pontixanthobacter aestiaquae]MXO84390.1 P-loop NTPase [Pontixanthobacter aestiaquae]